MQLWRQDEVTVYMLRWHGPPDVLVWEKHEESVQISNALYHWNHPFPASLCVLSHSVVSDSL